jgi:hypothetical protein
MHIHVFARVCIHLCSFVWRYAVLSPCVCVCVCERERERKCTYGVRMAVRRLRVPVLHLSTYVRVLNIETRIRTHTHTHTIFGDTFPCLCVCFLVAIVLCELCMRVCACVLCV